MWARFALALTVAAVLAAGEARAQVRSVELQGPRPFGYLIGDVIHLEVAIVVDEPFTLLPGSLPKPRPVTYWLDLKSVTADDSGVRAGQRRYRLALDYQTFYAPLEPRALEIPGFTLTVSNGANQAEAEVPPWTFLMSPLREIRPSRSGAATYMRADVAPALIPVATTYAAAIGCGIATLLLLGFLAHHRAWWPFTGQPKRPFARATRTVRRALAGEMRIEGYLTGLLSLHRAFDATAGRRVLADDVPAFLDRAPVFRPLESEIGRFFQASRRAFFGADPAGAMAALPPEALIAFGARLAVTERAAP